jgi:coenzyme F420 hydrogenase subunit beta
MRVNNGLLLPVIDLDKCTDCKVCVKCCPGFSLDMVGLNDQVFGRRPMDEVVGDFVDCYVGHSEDEEVSSVCSSGGVVDQLLIYALEKGLIDGAVVAGTRKDRPLEPEPFIARTREEVLSASRSKYCPVATGVVLKRLEKEEGRFAVVGLPCHIHGIRKAESVIPALKKKIVLHVGLFCGHTVSYDGTDFLLEKLQVRKGDVVRLDYRGNGWPDGMRVHLRDGRRLRLKYNRGWNAYWNVFSPFFFTPFRCLMCPDQFNELADVSVGDAWLRELKHQGRGESIIVVRTRFSEDLLEQLRREGRFAVSQLSVGKVKESQDFSVNFKKNHFAIRLGLFARLGHSVPVVTGVRSTSGGYVALLDGLLSYVSYRASLNKSLRSLLVHVPLPLFRLYFGLFKAVFFLSNAA